ncbi:uncharacterized protein LOC129619144 [Condylostylus longicornis]|uniref:uncharacterized protein LOC129619144 n=1 Tax=Condylostylus longicornis TaxID=2530218 RepID=UPI00244E3C0F|nr:uncharacterized protein LOC129619144 [Condylostylus longicornis]
MSQFLMEYSSLEKKINENLAKLVVWIQNHKLTLNIKKTKYMIISPTAPPLKIVISDEILEQVENFKYLGLWIDSALNWKTHTTFLFKKLLSVAGVFKRIAYFLPNNVKTSVFYSLFHSHVSYAIILWGVFSKENSDKLHTEFIHSQNRILLVQDFIKYKLILYIHDISNGELHSTTQLTTRSDHNEINTRSKQQIHLAKKNTTKFGTSTSIYKAIKLYNEIPENMKTLDNYKLKN